MRVNVTFSDNDLVDIDRIRGYESRTSYVRRMVLESLGSSVPSVTRGTNVNRVGVTPVTTVPKIIENIEKRTCEYPGCRSGAVGRCKFEFNNSPEIVNRVGVYCRLHLDLAKKTSWEDSYSEVLYDD